MIEARNPIGELVTGRQWDQLRDALRPMHPSDIADVIIEQPTETEGIIFRLLPREKAARAFAYLPRAEGYLTRLLMQHNIGHHNIRSEEQG